MGREAAYFLHLMQEMVTYCHLLQRSAQLEIQSISIDSGDENSQGKVRIVLHLPQKKYYPK
jgi:hypothetical protein